MQSQARTGTNLSEFPTRISDSDSYGPGGQASRPNMSPAPLNLPTPSPTRGAPSHGRHDS